MNKNNPIRTCVSCKAKISQSMLNRYRYKSGSLMYGKGEGRSFYLCDECLNKEEKILKKILDRHVKGIGLDASSLKEKLLDGKC